MSQSKDHPTQSDYDRGTNSSATIVTAVSAPPQPDNRYALGDEIARGGMGEVFRATDTVLDREVAVKVLQAKYAPTSGSARRFADEARITGQLQHPNIPAVHDLGTLPDGRPFLAMKLIKGQTLDDLLKGRADASVERGRFVAVFEAICQGVAYAHAHGVIHRDLKPQNIMVGSFGEVQVMDWGLAKVLGTRSLPDTDPESTSADTEIKSMRDSEDLLTQAGSVLGTPAYMPPEQAIGAVDQIDARSDVFGLGGILAAILTGRPPFLGETGESTRQLAAKGKVQDCFARLEASGSDPELVALCKLCLAPEKSDRPADADGVAKAVAALRAAADERARQAERDRQAVEVRLAEGRKRRRVMLVAGSGLVVVLAAGVVGTTLGLVEARRQETTARKESDKKDEALQAEADQRRRAETSGRQALRAADLLAGQMGTSLQGIAGTRSRTVVAALDKARTVYDELLADPNPPIEAVVGKARLLIAAAELYRVTRQTGKAKAAAEEAIALCDRLVDAAPDDAARNRYRRDRAKARHTLADTLRTQGYGAESIAEFRRSVAEYEAAGGADVPTVAAGHFAGAHTIIGNILVAHGDHDGAKAALEAGLVLRRAAAARQPESRYIQSGLGISLERLANLAGEAGDKTEAARLLREARRIAETDLAAATPGSTNSAVSMLRVLSSLAQQTPDPAERAECIAAAADVRRRYPDMDTDSRRVLREQLRAEFNESAAQPADAKALAAQRASLQSQLDSLTKQRKLCADYVRDDPDDYESLYDVANYDGRMAEAHLNLAALGDDPDGHRAAARALFEACVAAYRKTLARDPDNVADYQGLVYNLGQYSKVETDPGPAYARHFEYLTTNLDLYLRLVARYPRTAKWQAELRRVLMSVSNKPAGQFLTWPQAAKESRAAGPLVALARRLAARPPGATDDTWAAAEPARRRVAEYLADVATAGHLPADAQALRKQFPEPKPQPIPPAHTKPGPFDPAGPWRVFAPPAGPFRVSLPGEPARNMICQEVNEHTVTVTIYELGSDTTGTVGVIVAEYPPPLFGPMQQNIAKTLDGNVKGMVGNGKLLTRDEIDVGPLRLPGRSATWDLAGGKSRGRARVMFFGRTSVILVAIGPGEFTTSPAVNRVFDSFEIVGREPAPPPRAAKP